MLPSGTREKVVRVWVGRRSAKLVVSDVAPQAGLKRPRVTRRGERTLSVGEVHPAGAGMEVPPRAVFCAGVSRPEPRFVMVGHVWLQELGEGSRGQGTVAFQVLAGYPRGGPRQLIALREVHLRAQREALQLSGLQRGWVVPGLRARMALVRLQRLQVEARRRTVRCVRVLAAQRAADSG